MYFRKVAKFFIFSYSDCRNKHTCIICICVHAQACEPFGLVWNCSIRERKTNSYLIQITQLLTCQQKGVLVLIKSSKDKLSPRTTRNGLFQKSCPIKTHRNLITSSNNLKVNIPNAIQNCYIKILCVLNFASPHTILLK